MVMKAVIFNNFYLDVAVLEKMWWCDGLERTEFGQFPSVRV